MKTIIDVRKLLLAAVVTALVPSTGLAGAPWSAQVSTSTPAAFFTVGTYTSPQGFVRLQAPNGATVLAGNVVTITNGQALAALGTNGLAITAGISSNSLSQILTMKSTNLPVNITLVPQ